MNNYFSEGYSAGFCRRPRVSPYTERSDAGQSWQEGYQAGVDRTTRAPFSGYSVTQLRAVDQAARGG